MNTKENQRKFSFVPSDLNGWDILLGLVGAALVFWAIVLYFGTFGFASNFNEAVATGAIRSQANGYSGFGTGTFGDAFGAVNATFTGLAMLFLCISLVLQRSELKTLREERDAAQDTLAVQTKMNKTLAEDMEARRSEDRFFKAIENIRNLIHSDPGRLKFRSSSLAELLDSSEMKFDEFANVKRLKNVSGTRDPLNIYEVYGAIYESVCVAYQNTRHPNLTVESGGFRRMLGSLLPTDVASAVLVIALLRNEQKIEDLPSDLDLFSRSYAEVGFKARAIKQIEAPPT